MSIEEIFNNKRFIELRQNNYTLEEDDKSFIRKVLNRRKGIWQVLPLLNVLESLPADLLEPVLVSGLSYKDSSEPRRWIDKLQRLFAPEEIQRALLKIVKEGNVETKCRAIHTLYFVNYPNLKRRNENEDVYYEYFYTWDGEKYVRNKKETEEESVSSKQGQLIDSRIKALMYEFMGTDNLVLKYFLSFHLPHKVEEFPEELQIKAPNLISEITDEKFPKNATTLKVVIAGNQELENLIYENMNWD